MKKLTLLFLGMLLITNCDSDYDNDDNSNVGVDPIVNDVNLENNVNFGQVLTDSEGNTLYFFANDAVGGISNCNGGCADTWPPFFASDLNLDTGLLSSDFTIITRDDNASQLAYKGYPLYRFSNDASPGDINGDGVGGVWFVAKPDYAIMVSRQQLVGQDNSNNLIDLLEDGMQGQGETLYITDERGNTLYRFSNDNNLINNFTASDFSNDGIWPIYSSQNLAVPSIFDVDDFQLIDVFGQEQLTYKGWPLYGFGQDSDKGDTFGVGFPQPGIWFITNNNTATAPETSNVVYDEDADGDLSNAFDNPEGPFTLSEGSNIFISDQQGDPRDVDYITIVVPGGHELSALTLTDYVADNGNQAFIGIVNGSSFPNDANNTGAGDLLGGKTYGAQDLNADILPAIGNLSGSQEFSGPLPAGTYSIWLNQTGPNSKPTFDFTVSEI
ncbi:MAG: hypothetical protein AAF688_10450 [Bacteroidota bacterium]